MGICKLFALKKMKWMQTYPNKNITPTYFHSDMQSKDGEKRAELRRESWGKMHITLTCSYLCSCPSRVSTWVCLGHYQWSHFSEKKNEIRHSGLFRHAILSLHMDHVPEEYLQLRHFP